MLKFLKVLLLTVSVIIEPVQSQVEIPMFINAQFNVEELLFPPPEYDVENSSCESDNQCIEYARKECDGDAACLAQVDADHASDVTTANPADLENKKLTKCGLVEVYQITSISIAYFVPYSRHRLCVPKHQCNKQRIDKKGGAARLFIFCDAMMKERLGGNSHLNKEYFNAAISDHECLGANGGHAVGKACVKDSNQPNELLDSEQKKGRCAMLQTQALMDNDIRYDYPFQRQTLQVVCQTAAQLDALYIPNKIMFQNNLDFKVCDKYTGQQVALDQPVQGDALCPMDDAMNLIQYIDNFDEATSILWEIQKFYEAAFLRIFFYWPLMALLAVGTVCLVFALLMYGVYWFNEYKEAYITRQKLAKLFSPADIARIDAENKMIGQTAGPGKNKIPKFDQDGTDDEGEALRKPKRMPIDIDLENVVWDYKSYREWLETKNEALEADIDEAAGLDTIAQFFAKTIDKLSKNLAYGKKTRIELFDGVRQVLVKKVSDLDLSYLCTHVGELLESHGFEAQLGDRLKQKMAPAEEFFDKEVQIIAAANRKFVELEDYDNFKKSAIYQDDIGQEMIGDTEYSSSMFLRMYAHEHYARFQLALTNQFSDKMAENWKINNDFKKNAIKIWQSITDYESLDWEMQAIGWVVKILYYFCCVIFGGTFFAVLVGLFLFFDRYRHLQAQTVQSLPFSMPAIILSALYIYIQNYLALERAQSFDNVKDLMKGSVEAEITEITDAYKHFKATPGVHVVGIKDELRDFQKVTANYVYDESFVGEMEFRCREFSPGYFAIEFLSNIEEARRPIEVLQVLNGLEYFMSLNDYFENNKNRGKVTYDYDLQKQETEHVDLNLLDNDNLVKAANADRAFMDAKAMGQDSVNGKEMRYVLPKKPKQRKYEIYE